MKFTRPNIVVANPIPEETRIYYSKGDALFKLVLLFIGFGIGVYLVTRGPDYYAGGLMLCILTSIFIYIKGRNFIIDEPRIIINNKGIQTDTVPFYPWHEITEAKVKEIGWRRRGSHYLSYQVPEKHLTVKIDNLNISADDLGTLVHFYQERSENLSFSY
ncbi:hypothetical protein [Mucilaginibacter sp.]|uniref:hypothetical protein n=1 Tax=Mucilaginibacter sp. TaxID=1882438 RepID=UPI00261CE7CD|nr:hypothetical protein [Mucilaginibacter sp.]MDB4924746.1 hypothetical protein [Mucilaginibacter sp.]